MIDLTDRKSCFYWQTDRNLSAQEYAAIFLKRHELPETEITRILKNGITTTTPIKTLTIEPADENVIRGNVNIVRKVIINVKPYVVRMHPKSVKNGYFYVEKVAHEAAHTNNLPVPRILEVHEATSEDDSDFVLVEAASGVTLDNFLLQDKSNENILLKDAGRLLAKIHEIPVSGFGSFNNSIAKKEAKLVGLHKNYHDFIWAGLEENLERLIQLQVISAKQADLMKQVFVNNNFEPTNGPKLIHNDYADWNMLTDGKAITAILDWDECHGGDPVADLACWSTFFYLDRFKPFLEGYTSLVSLPQDFDERFHFYRLRYTISKMALRVKRYQVDKQDFIREKIELGKQALVDELKWFNITA